MDLTANYKNDSDEQIIYKRLLSEINDWEENLNFLEHEAESLARIAVKYLNSSEIENAFEEYKVALHDFQNEINNANNALENINECDSIQCDMYYLNEHKVVEKKYFELIKNFRVLKNNMYIKMINNSI